MVFGYLDFLLNDRDKKRDKMIRRIDNCLIFVSIFSILIVIKSKGNISMGDLISIDSLITAVFSAILTWVVSKILYRNSTVMEMRWKLFEQMRKELYEAKRQENEFYEALVELYVDIQSVKKNSGSVTIKFKRLINAHQEYTVLRNSFYFYKEMYILKTPKVLRKILQLLKIKTKIMKFADALDNLSLVMQQDLEYLERCLKDLQRISKDDKLDDHHKLIALTNRIDDIKADHLLLLKEDESKVFYFMYDSFKNIL